MTSTPQSPSTTLSPSRLRLGIVCPMANEADNAVAFARQVLERCGGLDGAEVPIHYRSTTARVSGGALIDALRSVGLMFVFRLTGRLHT